MSLIRANTIHFGLPKSEECLSEELPGSFRFTSPEHLSVCQHHQTSNTLHMVEVLHSFLLFYVNMRTTDIFDTGVLKTALELNKKKT